MKWKVEGWSFDFLTKAELKKKERIRFRKESDDEDDDEGEDGDDLDDDKMMMTKVKMVTILMMIMMMVLKMSEHSEKKVSMATDLASSKIDNSEYNPSNIFSLARGIGLNASLDRISTK